MLLHDEQTHLRHAPRPDASAPTDARCAEYQSDGVPCPSAECDCEHCARARARLERPVPFHEQGDGADA
jgi:hypothetical protein